VKRRRVILILLACVVAGVVVFIVWPREREPEYQGRRLSWWIKGAWRQSENGAVQEERVQAIREIGTNALPYLVKWIGEAADPHFSKFEGIIIGKLNSRCGDAWVRFRFGKEFRATDAVTALAILGPVARPTNPELYKLGQTTNLAVQLLCSLARASLGDESIRWYGTTANRGFSPANANTKAPLVEAPHEPGRDRPRN
jgi:hypothetical protein